MNRKAIAPLMAMLATTTLSTAALAAPASPIGRWQTPERGGVVEVFACGNAICGKIAGGGDLAKNPNQRDVNNKNPAERNRLIKGLVFMYGFTGGPKTWSNGKLYRPTNGSTYSGSITLQDANTLQLTGCIFRPLCQSQTWKRIQ